MLLVTGPIVTGNIKRAPSRMAFCFCFSEAHPTRISQLLSSFFFSFLFFFYRRPTERPNKEYDKKVRGGAPCRQEARFPLSWRTVFFLFYLHEGTAMRYLRMCSHRKHDNTALWPRHRILQVSSNTASDVNDFAGCADSCFLSLLFIF